MIFVPLNVLPIRPVDSTALRRERPVRQRDQVGLPRVVHPPEGPHARDVVLGDVTVVQEVARGLLDAAGSALDLEVVGLARADGLGVEALRGRPDGRRVLAQPGVGVVVGRVGHGVEAPAVAAAVQVEDVELLRTDVHDPDLGRVGEVAPHHRGRRLTEGVGAVGVALLLGEVEQPVAEGLAAVVEGELAGSVRAGGVVHQGELRAVGGGQRLVVVAELVVQQDGLAETTGGRRAGGHAGHVDAGRLDDRLPAGDQRLAEGAGVPVRRARRLHDQGPEQTMVDEGPVARSGVDVVTTLLARVVGDRVPVLHGLPRRDRGRGVGTQLVAGGRGLVLEAVDVHPQVAVGGLVGERDRDAVPLVRADHQGLDRVVAEPDRDLPALLLGADRRDGAGEGVHVTAGVVVTVPVGGDVDIDRGHVEGAVDGAAGQAAGGSCR